MLEPVVSTEDVLKRLEESAPRAMLSEADLERMDELPAAKRRAAARRLAVASAWSSGERKRLFANATDAAKSAGMSRSGFFSLIRKVEEFGLDGLGLYLEKTGPAAAIEARNAVISEAAIRILNDRPAVGTSELVRALQGEVESEVSDTTFLRVIEEVRANAPATGAFGTFVAYDAASMDAVDADGRRQRLYAILDVTTAIIRGWSVMPDGLFEAGYAEAVKMAIDPSRAVASRADVAGLALSESSSRVELSLPKEGDFAFAKAIAAAGARVVFNHRRIGRRLIAALGPRIGGFTLSAGFAPSDVSHRSRTPTALPLITAGGMTRIGSAIAAHDHRRIDLAPAGDGGTSRYSGPPLADVVQRMAARLCALG